MQQKFRASAADRSARAGSRVPDARRSRRWPSGRCAGGSTRRRRGRRPPPVAASRSCAACRAGGTCAEVPWPGEGSRSSGTDDPLAVGVLLLVRRAVALAAAAEVYYHRGRLQHLRHAPKRPQVQPTGSKPPRTAHLRPRGQASKPAPRSARPKRDCGAAGSPSAASSSFV